jgi:hypothetical protein
MVDKQDISNIMSYLSDNRAPLDAQKYEMRYFASMFFGKCLKSCSRNKKKTPFQKSLEIIEQSKRKFLKTLDVVQILKTINLSKLLG